MKIKFIKPFRFIGNAPDYGSDITVPVGYVVDLKNDETTQWLIDNGFAEEVKESGWWKPKNGIDYYYVNDAGVIISREGFLSMSTIDDKRVDIGNAFRSKAAAERYKDYLKAVETVRHDEGFMTRSSDGLGFAIHLKDDGQLGATVTSSELAAAFRQHAGEFYFDTDEHAKASGKKHPDEWKTILNYDWSKE